MEAIVPAFLLALLTQLGDRPALLTAILADRFGRPLVVALAAGAAHGVGNMIAALAGGAMTPLLNAHAQALLIAIALLLGGFGGLWPVKLPSRLERWRMGSLLTPFLGIFVISVGERTQFFTFALAARNMPELAAAGATLGAFAVALVAAMLGELGWRGISFRRIQLAVAILFLATGAYIGLGALRLL